MITLAAVGTGIRTFARQNWSLNSGGSLAHTRPAGQAPLQTLWKCFCSLLLFFQQLVVIIFTQEIFLWVLVMVTFSKSLIAFWENSPVGNKFMVGKTAWGGVFCPSFHTVEWSAAWAIFTLSNCWKWEVVFWSFGPFSYFAVLLPHPPIPEFSCWIFDLRAQTQKFSAVHNFCHNLARQTHFYPNFRRWAFPSPRMLGEEPCLQCSLRPNLRADCAGNSLV